MVEGKRNDLKEQRRKQERADDYGKG